MRTAMRYRFCSKTRNVSPQQPSAPWAKRKPTVYPRTQLATQKENEMKISPRTQGRSKRAAFGMRLAFGALALTSVVAWPQVNQAHSSTVQKAVPYALPVVLPAPVSSPGIDPAAPYTSTVQKLIAQLEPSNPPTLDELKSAAHFLVTENGANGTCHNLANVVSPLKTTPRIMPQCFSDGLFINVISGPNKGKTSGMSSLLLLSSSFDLDLANAMGQLEGREGRNLMVTGLLGPQADTDLFINWARGHQTPGEDPFLNGEITAAEVNGIQGQGLMSQVKHFAGYNGADDHYQNDIQDQAFHEILMPPYEIALSKGGASSLMCAYSLIRDRGSNLDHSVESLTSPGPYGTAAAMTWSLNEAHYACENPFLLTYTLRDLWKFKGFVGSDYGAVHSTSGFLQADTREDPSSTYFGVTNPKGEQRIDATGSNCADAGGKPESCTAPGAVHVAGIPGAGCPAMGCGLAEAVNRGLVPLSVFNQALARVLYQEERFDMLGCDNASANCANPGGIDGDRSGTAPLKDGPTSGTPILGTKYGDAAIVEKVAEEGGILFKNEKRALPIASADLQGGIAISGGGAEYLIANPNNESSAGFSDRNAINPLQQLEALSGNASAFIYTPAGAPTGIPVSCGMLTSAPVNGPAPSEPPSVTCCAVSGLQRFTRIDSSKLHADEVDGTLDYTAVSREGQLSGGRVYRWEGWLYVPEVDRYAFRVQHSSDADDAKVTFSLDGEERTLGDAIPFYHGQYYGAKGVDVSLTNAGYTEGGLNNMQCAIPVKTMVASVPGPPAGNTGGTGGHAKTVVPCAETPAIGWHKIVLTYDTTDLSTESKVSFRFAISRMHGDIEAAAAASEGRAMAIVFVNDEGRHVTPDGSVSSVPEEQIQLINAVAEKNPNTVVVLNTGTPIVLKEWIDNLNVKAVLNMWQAGQEGGTATARLLLGQANPSGHSPMTWPLNSTDTIAGYSQPRGLIGTTRRASIPSD